MIFSYPMDHRQRPHGPPPGPRGLLWDPSWKDRLGAVLPTCSSCRPAPGLPATGRILRKV